jgi:S-(hydroxymethyl)glutathione dehydrogenase/alcohol dehydrogenase
MKTPAAILVETGRPLEIWDLEIPPLRPGQVLVEVEFSGACRTQILEAWGLKGEDRWLPHCLGHEGVGRVLEAGPGAARFKAGNRVVLSWLKGEGMEAGGAKYASAGRTVNAGAMTTFQKISVCSENRLAPMPSGVSPEHAVMLGCALPTGYGCVVNVARARQGESIAVFGAGGIGQSAIMAAKAIGLDPIIAVDIAANKRDLAQKSGATHCIDANSKDVADQIRAATANQGVDIAIEATGEPVVMRLAMECVRNQGGRAVIAGNANAGAMLAIPPALFNQGRSLLGTWGGDSVPGRDFPAIAAFMAEGRIDVAPLLNRRYGLGEINTALSDLKDGRVGRPLIDMSI